MRAFTSQEFGLPDLLARKRATNQRISVCLPARDEEATVGDVVAAIPDELVDEIVVVDDGSTDDTAAVLASYRDRIT
ncbi:MAG: glycosyltransferase, partial [Actinobacteria bacterium]|nr:glycosyltransferase [Actinomycetota bacterium]